MSSMISPAELEAVVAELAPITGGKLQRVDVVAERELVLEVRCPGRTVRVLVSARPGLGRLHAVEARPPRELPGGALQALLRQRLVGKPLVALEAEGRTVRLDALTAVLEVRLDGGKDAIHLGPPSGRPAPAPSGEVALPEVFARSAALEARAAARVPGERDRVLRARLLEVLARRRKKQARLLAAVEGDRARLLALAEEGHRGELLKTALGRVARGATSVVVDDWVRGEPVTVPLDPALGTKENLARCFARARKASRGLPVVEQRLARLGVELAALDARRRAVEAASGEALLALADAAPAGALEGVRLTAVEGAARAASATARPSPLDAWSRRFVALDGAEIRVGKGARENDRLTFSGARGDDVWLHASGVGGAHVILRNEKGKSPHPEALLDAAHLAAHHSAGRREAKVEVVWTEARHVKKTKGDPPGRVSVARGRTLLVALDERRLDRLLGRDPTAAPR